jgi:hypothetical protein
MSNDITHMGQSNHLKYGSLDLYFAGQFITLLLASITSYLALSIIKNPLTFFPTIAVLILLLTAASSLYAAYLLTIRIPPIQVQNINNYRSRKLYFTGIAGLLLLSIAPLQSHFTGGPKILLGYTGIVWIAVFLINVAHQSTLRS